LAAYNLNPQRETDLGYTLNTLKAKTIHEIYFPPESFKAYELFLIKIVKELQLDEIDAAKQSLLSAYAQWNKENFLLNPKSKKDFKVVKKIQKTGLDLYNSLNIQQAPYWFPSGERNKIISNLEKITSVPKFLLREEDEPSRHISVCDLLSQHLSALLKTANNKNFQSDLKPLSIMDAVISDLIRKDDITHLTNTFHPHLTNIKPKELEEIARLTENISNKKSLLAQSKKIAELYPDNILYDFINYRLAYEFSTKTKEIKISNKKIQKNTYALLKGSWHLAERNKPEKAKELLNYVRKIKNKKTWETIEMCLILQSLKEYEQALSILDKEITDKSNNSSLYNSRGVILRFLGEKDLAMKDFKRALKLNPFFYQARLNLASMYVLSNNKAFAREHYLKISMRKDLPPEIIEMVRKELSSLK